ncbi:MULTISPECIES: glycosyltransferase [Pseudomonas]|uniref:Glycosyltransferase n=1 Tax=Pseudomonas azadiae TaxID=2843612 RepID=A0ABS6P251_9PSED|nr:MULTISPECIES: glycosyltransferase [Pseudomonas]MBV4454523.1 glycosyltransferase [Pseudomonas azadiae]NMF39677.1 glycosyltransferase family 4 protein [Pseudomonas sp. SWRI 103]
MTKQQKICVVATVPVALKVFMVEHINKLAETYSVTVMANAASEDIYHFLDKRIKFIPLPIQRKVSMFSDVLSLIRLFRIFSVERFDCVLSIMPKSGLLTMLAGYFARVPCRIHIFTGQVWYTKKGFSRFALKKLDQLLAFAATHLLADSPSQRDFLIEENVVKPPKIEVLGKGSISGVDLARFKPNAVARARIRSELGLDDAALVFLFMARLTRAKGIVDLARAFTSVATRAPNAHLLVVGPDEESLEGVITELSEKFKGRCHRIGFTNDPEGYMAAADIFSLPSYREGFSLATIQAAGVGLPAIASRIYGLSDAVQEGVTGLLHRPGAIDEMSDAMVKLYSDRELRRSLAEAARHRAHTEFAQPIIIEEMSLYINRLLA